MIISNFQTWQAVMGGYGCCPPTAFPAELEKEANIGVINMGGVARRSDTAERERVMSWTMNYSISGSTVTTSSTEFACRWSFVATWIVENVITTTENDPKSGTTSISYGAAINFASAFESGVAALLASPDWETITGGNSAKVSFKIPSHILHITLGDITVMRYRHVIASVVEGMPFTGSYFLMEWDIVKETRSRILGGPPSTFETVASLSWEWTGPGDPEDSDSWKSPWFDMSAYMVPPFPSDKDVFFTVANRRSKHFVSSRLGNKWLTY